MTCPEINCPQKITRSVVDYFGDKETTEPFEEEIVSLLMRSSTHLRYCPRHPKNNHQDIHRNNNRNMDYNESCDRIAIGTIDRMDDNNNFIHCSCGMIYCFVCGCEDHLPATCSQMRQWKSHHFKKAEHSAEDLVYRQWYYPRIRSMEILLQHAQDRFAEDANKSMNSTMFLSHDYYAQQMIQSGNDEMIVAGKLWKQLMVVAFDLELQSIKSSAATASAGVSAATNETITMKASLKYFQEQLMIFAKHIDEVSKLLNQAATSGDNVHSDAKVAGEIVENDFVLRLRNALDRIQLYVDYFEQSVSQGVFSVTAAAATEMEMTPDMTMTEDEDLHAATADMSLK
jgi:soluble cytochrome b562